MHTIDQPSQRNSRRARAEAAAWVVRLHGPDRSPELEAGFRDWLAADLQNRRQFERVTDVWDAGAIRVPGMPRVAPVAPSARVARRLAVAAVAAVVAIGGWSITGLLEPDYVTALGEQRIVRLSDGSRVSLNSDSRVEVTYHDDRRSVRIDRGEAFFEVAKDPSRPFLVQAGSYRVKALGTAFNVRYEDGRAAVTLVEGKVAVSARRARAASTPVPADIVLIPGQRLVMAGTAPAQIDKPSLEVITAWRRGEVVFDQTRLADAIVEMNRYDQTRLVVDDPAIAELRVSGIYHSGDNAGFARMIARLHGLRTLQQGERIGLRAAVSGNAAHR